MSNLFVKNQSLRIAINAQLLPNSGAGGVESVLIGLISALGKINDGHEEYIIIGSWQEPNWLKPYLGPNQRIVQGPRPLNTGKGKSALLKVVKRALAPIKPLVRELFSAQPARLWPGVPISNGFYENLGCDVIHFPFQNFTLCALPIIYNPHDLQHLHYPRFFTPTNIAWREVIYPAGCHFAHTVVAASQWIKQDIVRHYHLDPDKIQVIPFAPSTQAYPEPKSDIIEDIRKKYRLAKPFAFYPAMTWEHKNHLRLLEALAILRDREGLIIRLVCTGSRDPRFWPQIEASIQALHLQEQVQFLGLVSPEDLRVLYRLAQFVVVPTLFEAASGPVFEAWQENVPVTCSTVTSLPEQAGDAALLFDPFSVPFIADAVRRMATDEHLRTELICKGKLRLCDFSWERTAKAYRAVYRRAARRPLSDEDQWLLSWDWMRNPNSMQKEM